MSQARIKAGSSGAPASSSRLARVFRGMRVGFPIFLGYAPVGVAFGILARTGGWSVSQATVCSATAIAGAGQFIGLAGLVSGAGAASALIATSVVNLRYVLFGSTLSGHLKGARIPTQAFLGFTLTDETFALNIADIRAGTATFASMAGVGIIAWFGWVLGTLVGALGAGAIGDPNRWGVGFAMPAMFTALFVALAEDRRHVIVGVVAAGVALLLPLAARLGAPLPVSWFVVISSIAAASIGAAVFADVE